MVRRLQSAHLQLNLNPEPINPKTLNHHLRLMTSVTTATGSAPWCTTRKMPSMMGVSTLSLAARSWAALDVRMPSATALVLLVISCRLSPLPRRRPTVLLRLRSPAKQMQVRGCWSQYQLLTVLKRLDCLVRMPCFGSSWLPHGLAAWRKPVGPSWTMSQGPQAGTCCSKHAPAVQRWILDLGCPICRRVAPLFKARIWAQPEGGFDARHINHLLSCWTKLPQAEADRQP